MMIKMIMQLIKMIINDINSLIEYSSEGFKNCGNKS